MLHAFSGDADFAAECLALGLHLSFAGNVTYPNKKFEPLRAVAADVPDDRLLVETDSPYLVPQAFRGKQRRNEPAHVVQTAAFLAELARRARRATRRRPPRPTPGGCSDCRNVRGEVDYMCPSEARAAVMDSETEMSREQREWLEEFEAAARRPLPLRFRYAFIHTYKPVLDDAKFRAFDTMQDYRRWCEENLPDWLGYGRV